MTSTEIDAALAAANPLSDGAATALPLHDAEVELLERIAATAVPGRRSRGLGMAPRRRRLALVLLAAAVIAAMLTVLPLGNQSGGPAPAFAASLVRFANNSPLVLLRLPGWHVVYADEQPGGYGEMHLVRGPANADGSPRGVSLDNEASLAGAVAQLTWYKATPPMRRYVAGGREHAVTGLGVIARRFIREGGSRRWLDITATFIYDGRELTFRATVTGMPMFRAELRALVAVDTTTWLRAMPPSVVDAADSSETIRAMLKGIPLPPGLDAARIRGARLIHDRYQLGAAVTGTVACMWIADWNRARAAGDTAMVRRTTAAMATSPHWPILHEMARQGAWPQVLIGYARAMRRGSILEGGVEPLASAVNSGLGCRELGIRLGP
jgi:hypothetical protein